MHVLPSTWAFHLKCFPNCLTKKFKARFCIHGDRQVEGVDFFETWAPVIQWTTVRSMMVLASCMNLVSTQANITVAFVHAPLGPDEHIYVLQPAGFQHDGDLVSKLKKSVYGLCQSPRNFFKYLSDHLGAQGLLPSKLDPCLFVTKSMVVVVYVDLWADARRAERVWDKLRIWFMPTGWRPADVAARYPQAQQDLALFRKFEVALGRAQQAYVAVQFVVYVALGSYLMEVAERLPGAALVLGWSVMALGLFVLGALLAAQELSAQAGRGRRVDRQAHRPRRPRARGADARDRRSQQGDRREQGQRGRRHPLDPLCLGQV